MTSTSTSTIPSYISLPQSAIRIPAPSITTSTSPQRPISLARTSIPSFPLTSIPPTIIRKFSVPTASSVSSNVSDLLLGSLLPPNLPKLPNAAGRGGGSGRPRELSTQSEALSLPLVSNNFRRFVTKVCE